MKKFILLLLILNALGFLLMYIDKRNAKKKRWRIPENVLMTVAAIGGSFGSYAAMCLFHHKTRHKKFSIGLPVMMVIHIIIVCDMMNLGAITRFFR